MLRIDAQHSFAPPSQGPEWFGQILRRNRFEASVYLTPFAHLESALETASRFSYIKCVTPACHFEELLRLPAHPLVRSVRLLTVTPPAVAELQRRGLSLEADAAQWPFAADIPVALDGFPDVDALPPNVYIKLTGFRLPPDPARALKLHRFLRLAGPERLLFASGWPHGGATWKETLAAFTQALGPMPMDLREQVLGGTAGDFYRLG